jgi:hypothetical protein
MMSNSTNEMNFGEQYLKELEFINTFQQLSPGQQEVVQGMMLGFIRKPKVK